jgi:hypothetical protein
MLLSGNRVLRSTFATALARTRLSMSLAAPLVTARQVAVDDVDGHDADPSGDSIGGAAAFQAAATGTHGNSVRDSLVNPGPRNFDMAFVENRSGIDAASSSASMPQEPPRNPCISPGFYITTKRFGI